MAIKTFCDGCEREIPASVGQGVKVNIGLANYHHVGVVCPGTCEQCAGRYLQKVQTLLLKNAFTKAVTETGGESLLR